MNKYEAPTIKHRDDLRVALGGFSQSNQGGSDAEIKHGVTPVQPYQAPTITEHRELEGKLEYYSEIPT